MEWFSCFEPDGIPKKISESAADGNKKFQGAYPCCLKTFDTQWDWLGGGFTRSRPCKKDHNGHVEQKNWTHVRRLLGYDRLEDPRLVDLINALYRECWEPLHNYFLPSAKLEKKCRVGTKVKRRYDAPRTTCERLLASPDVSVQSKSRLKNELARLNPFERHRRLEEGLRLILQRPLHSGSSPVSFTFEATGRNLPAINLIPEALWWSLTPRPSAYKTTGPLHPSGGELPREPKRPAGRPRYGL